MEITTLQIVLVFIVACIAGMGSILDEFQFHRPLIACTTGEYRSWGYENRYYYRWYAGNDRAGLDEHRCCSCA